MTVLILSHEVLFNLIHVHCTDCFSITTLPYLDKDQLGGYTMLSGDIVLFNLAIDRRNGAQRATNVQVHKLIEEQKDKNAREMVNFFLVLYFGYNWEVYYIIVANTSSCSLVSRPIPAFQCCTLKSWRAWESKSRA